MKKIISLLVSGVAICLGLFNGYLLFFKQGQAVTEAIDSQPTEAVVSEETNPASAVEEVVADGRYADGTYTGQVVSTNRGDYQVQATIAEGELVDIAILQYPNDNPTSESINSQNLPIYTAEALENQSAEVTQISGASEAYKGFSGSLQDALNQAS